MYKNLIPHWQPLPKNFKITIIITLLVGLFFRFANLENRPYWHDETYTLLRTSGHSIVEITQSIFDGRIISRDAVLSYQQMAPDKTWRDALMSIVAEEPQRSPLYYLITHWWRQWFGDSITAIRSLSVFISLLMFPSLYWLCIELFSQPIVAWITLLLAAVSPFHVHYAQEIREYSLWTVTLILMNAALLRSLRLKTISAWGVYSITVALSFYTFILTGFIAIAHIIYVAVIERWHRTEQSIAFLKALILGLGIFAPWMMLSIFDFSQVQETSAWMNYSMPLPALIGQWFSNFLSVFFRDQFSRPLQWLLAIAIPSLIAVASFFLWRRSSKVIWLFLALLVFLPFLGLAMPDVIMGGIRSVNRRYLVPSVLSIQMTIAFFLSTQLIQTRTHDWKQLQWRSVTVLLITMGVVSCWLQIVRPPKTDDQAIADLINQAAPSIVISNEASIQGGGTIGDVLVLSHLVNSQTQFQLVIKPNVPKIPPHTHVFLYKPFALLKQQMQSQCSPKPIYHEKLFECRSL
jgi:uncharacterized membrane protein